MRSTGTARTMRDSTFAIRQITFDCNDPSRFAEFWSSATGCEIVADYGDFVMVGSTPALGFQRVADPTPGKNRVHIDGCWVPLNSAVMRHRDSFGPLCRIQKATSFAWAAPKRNYTSNLNSTACRRKETFSFVNSS